MSITKRTTTGDPRVSTVRYRDPVLVSSATRPPRILVGMLTGEVDPPASAPATPNPPTTSEEPKREPA